VRVVVIGAGVIGCAVAYELASRGAEVQVVDPRPIAGGATHASAGMLAPYSEGHDQALLRLGLASLDLYDGFVARVRHDSPRDFDYERSGTLQVAAGEIEQERLAEQARTLAAAGAAHQWLDRSAARDIEPALGEGIDAGLLLPDQGYINAPGFTMALADAAERHGVRFMAARVSALSSEARGEKPSGVRIRTSDGTLDADTLVLAAGSWSSAIAGVTTWPAPVKPIRGQLLHLRAPARLAARIVWGSSCYVVPWSDGTVLVGATVEDVGFDEHPTAQGVRHLLDAVHTLLPGADGATFREVRVGLRPKTPDELPIIGASSTMRGVVHATGHYRNGILLTPLTAVVVADLVLDGREDEALRLTKPARFGL